MSRAMSLAAGLIVLAGACDRTVIDRRTHGFDAGGGPVSTDASSGSPDGHGSTGVGPSSSGEGAASSSGMPTVSSASSVVSTGSMGDTTSAGGGGAGGGVLGPDTVIASGLAFPTSIALAGSHVYVTESGTGPSNGTLSRVLKTGGTVEVLAASQASPWMVTSSDASVAWVNFGSASSGEVRRFSLTDGSIETMADGLYQPFSLVFQGDSIVFVSGMPRQLHVAHPDHSLETVLPDVTAALPLASDGSRSFFLGSQDGSVYTSLYVRHADGTVDVVYPNTNPGVPPLFGMAVHQEDIYLAITDGSITRGSTDGAEFQSLVTLTQSADGGIAVSDGYIYFADYSPIGDVSRMPIAGGTPTVIAPSQGGPHGIVADDDAIYWVDAYAGEIHRMTK